MGDLFLRLAVHARTLTPVPRRLSKNFTTFLVCIDGALDACHRIYSLCIHACPARLGGSRGVVPLAMYSCVPLPASGVQGFVRCSAHGNQAQELLPSSFLALAASPGASTASPSRRRVRVLGLCSFRCILPALRCMSLPVPVNLNRFLAPECDFIFGMFDPFLVYVLASSRCLIRRLAHVHIRVEVVRR